ncbi:MAG: hypothetical protein BWZ10_03256 [candidate division BRC1 bacterium ADurb.BinA364]|nr:MAG: hypothetical protein BWZ10_03256 [candidate division BRC1 bacterium ADurb.BinA364]
MHANEKFMDWRELMAMQIDLRDSGFRIACWAKRADSGSEWRMPIEYLLFSYCSFLLTYEPRSPHYWGGNWGQGWSSRSPFAPPAFVYADLGAPRERFAEIDQALWLGSSGIFARRYEKGLIAVNASKSDSAGLRLEQPLYDVVAEQWVEKTELKPLSARLLLSRQMPLRH